MSFELLLFSTDSHTIDVAVRAGVNGVIVDWEHRGKHARQSGLDTQINHHTVDDLSRVRRTTASPIVCRVNGVGPGTRQEIDAAIEGGATEILLPMVRSAAEVEAALAMVAGRVELGILIETAEAVARARDFVQLPLSRVYVGLNDLAIARRSPSIFDAVIDGTVERLRELFHAPFGFGGLTRPDRGQPIPCRLLMAEMMRLDCRFSFLRRSFHRDVPVTQMDEGVGHIRQGLADARRRSAERTVEDRRAFEEAVQLARLPIGDGR